MSSFLLRSMLLTITFLVVSESATAQTPCDSIQAQQKQCASGEQCIIPRKRKLPTCRNQLSDHVYADNCANYSERLGTCLITWDGPITQQDAKALINFLKALPAPTHPLKGVMVTLNSDGGSVEASLEAGRQLRANNARINVYTRCASACVFLLAGGVNRSTWQGEVLIHRPYSLDTSQSDLDNVQESFERTNRLVATYLRDMNLPDSLLDAMLRVPPHRGRLLSEHEQEAFGLNQKDPVYEQAMNALAAEKKGMTMTEYLSRKQREEKCLEEYPPSNSMEEASKKGQFCESVAWD